jgi:hypothetical protein
VAEVYVSSRAVIDALVVALVVVVVDEVIRQTISKAQAHQNTPPRAPARVTQAASSINDRTKSRSYRVDNWVDKNIQ